MPSEVDPERDLLSEIARLHKVVQALMDRAERSMAVSGSDFAHFQTAILLEDQVRSRTEALESALRENEKMTRVLQQLTTQMRVEIQERKRVQEALRQSEERYRTATEAALDAFITVDEHFRILFVNSAAERMFGHTRTALLGGNLDILFPCAQRDANTAEVRANLNGLGRTSVVKSIQITCMHTDGREIPVEFSFGEYRQGGMRFYTGIARDITERKRNESLREGQQQVLELIALNEPLERILTKMLECIEAQSPGMRCSVCLLDTEKGVLRKIVAPSLPREYIDALTGLRAGPCAGSCGTALHRREPVFVRDIRQDPLWDDCRALAEPYGLRACWSVPVISGKGEALGAFAMYYDEIRDPTAEDVLLIQLAVRMATIAIERKRDEAHILHMAHHDALTGLPNRVFFEDRIQQAIAHSRRDGSGLAVLFIDLDRFKPINDSLGHQVGDGVLREVAGRMQLCLREYDGIARLGGDEFVICLPHLAGADDAAQVARKLLNELNKPMRIDGHALHVEGSIGMSLYPQDGDSAEALIQAADEAMYAAKKAGGGYRFRSVAGADSTGT